MSNSHCAGSSIPVYVPVISMIGHHQYHRPRERQLTNGDNYYAPRFVEFMFEAIDKHHLDVAFCDIVHSYTYRFFRTRPFRNYIDMGCFIARSAAAKSVGFRDKTFTGDATYFEDLLTLSRRLVVGKINKVLMVHN